MVRNTRLLVTLDCVNGPTLEITTSLKQFSYFLCPVGFSHHCLLNNAEMEAPICPFSLEKNKSTYLVYLAKGYTEVLSQSQLRVKIRKSCGFKKKYYFFYKALCRPVQREFADVRAVFSNLYSCRSRVLTLRELQVALVSMEVPGIEVTV